MTQKRIFAKIIIFFKKVLDKFRLSWYNNLVECGGIAQLARALGSYPGCHWFESDCRYHRPVGQEVKTSPFHGGIMGSIPVRVTISIAHIWLNKAVCELLFFARFGVWSLFGLYCDFLVFTQGKRSFRRPAFSFCQRTALLRLPDLSSPVLLGTYDSKYCSSLKLERVLNRPTPPPHQLLRL